MFLDGDGENTYELIWCLIADDVRNLRMGSCRKSPSHEASEPNEF